MGNADSTYDEEEDPHARFDGIETLGYRVLGVQPDSPASSAGLVSFFDFLVGCDGTMLLGNPNDVEPGEEYDDVDFPLLLQESVGKELTMLVWNIKSQTQRLVKITPSNTWGGTGLLGVTIRLDDYGGADERLVRVLTVEHNSPAAIAGLAPMKDYLLGTTSHSFDDTMVLANVLQANVDRVVEIYVYNTESDVVRVVTLMPTLSWGGMGLLGAEVGTGYLHRLPRSCRDTDGKSFERRVRTGPRPADGVQGNAAATAGRAAASAEKDLVNLTAVEGTANEEIHFEPQMEMEPEPEEASKETHEPNDENVEEKKTAEIVQEEPVKKDVAEEQTTSNGLATAAEAPSPASAPLPSNDEPQQQPTTTARTAPPSAETPAAAPPANDAAALFGGPPPPIAPLPVEERKSSSSISVVAKETGYSMAPPPFIGKVEVPPPPPGPGGLPPPPYAGGGLPPPPIAQLSPTNENGGVDLR